MGYVDENGVPVDVNSKADVEQTGLDADATAADRAAVEDLHAEVIAAQTDINTKLIVYGSDDAISVTITVAANMVVSEATSPYPSVTLELVTPETP